MKITERSVLKNKLFINAVMFIFLYPKVLDYSTARMALAFQWCVRYLPYSFFPIFILIFWNINKDAQKLYWLLFGYKIIFLIPNLLYGAGDSEIKILLKNTVWIIAVIVIVSSAIKLYPQIFLHFIKNLCNLFVVLNLALNMIFPYGLSRIEMTNTAYGVISWSDAVNFIDVDNRLALFMILAIYINILFQYSRYEKIKNYLWIIIPIINIVVVWSGTGILAMVCLGIYLFFSKSKIINKLVSGYWIFGVYMIFLAVFVVFQRFRIFELLIVNILHKNMTLSNRTTIWAYYVELIIQKPILGYGTAGSGGLFNWNGQVWYAHNQILDILVQGGICALVLFIITIIAVKKHVGRKNSILVYGLFNICLLSYLVIGIAEHFLINFNMYFYVFLAIAYNSRLFFQSKTKDIT